MRGVTQTAGRAELHAVLSALKLGHQLQRHICIWTDANTLRFCRRGQTERVRVDVHEKDADANAKL